MSFFDVLARGFSFWLAVPRSNGLDFATGARGINKLHVWFVWQIEVLMGTTNWHKKQGSEVLSFLREAFMLQCISAAPHTVTELICKSGHCYLVSLKATNNCITNHKVTDFTTYLWYLWPKNCNNSTKFKISVFIKIFTENGYKIVSKGPIVINLESCTSGLQRWLLQPCK